MSSKPKCFLVRLDTAEIVERLSDSEAGQLFKALYKYSADGDIPKFNSTAPDIAFLTFRKDIDYNIKEYERRSEINRANGRKGGAPKGNRNAQKAADKPEEPKEQKPTADYKAEVTEIIEYLNKKAETHYKPNSKTAKKHIVARLNEGFTVAEFKQAIDNKVKEWKDTKFAPYLRPETLFGTKFESYLNTPRKRRKASYDIEELEKISFL